MVIKLYYIRRRADNSRYIIAREIDLTSIPNPQVANSFDSDLKVLKTILRFFFQGSKCFWAGTSPFCTAVCGFGFYAYTKDAKGDGKRCLIGLKKYCCPKHHSPAVY